MTHWANFNCVDLCRDAAKHASMMALAAPSVQLNAEILRNLGALAEDESMLKRVAKYLRKLVSEKEADPTLLSKEDFFASVDEAREQIKRGEGVEMLPDESLDEFLNRVG